MVFNPPSQRCQVHQTPRVRRVNKAYDSFWFITHPQNFAVDGVTKHSSWSFVFERNGCRRWIECISVIILSSFRISHQLWSSILALANRLSNSVIFTSISSFYWWSTWSTWSMHFLSFVLEYFFFFFFLMRWQVFIGDPPDPPDPRILWVLFE